MIDLLKYRKKVLPDKSKLMVNVSGGRTSMFMAKFINESEAFKGIQKRFIFANTGKEREETLRFVKNCQDHFRIKIDWIEADVRPKGKGVSFKVVDFDSASRNGEPFDSLVRKLGIPNKDFHHCTRDLKKRPIKKATEAFFGSGCWMAIGIRHDERNRINRKAAKKDRYIYPLTDIFPVDEEFVRVFWDGQPFDLVLKDYEGNCDFCHKKSLRKRLTLIKENPSVVRDWLRWERSSEYVFDRDGYTIEELIQLSKKPFKEVKDLHESRTGSLNIDKGSKCHCIND